MATSHNLRRFNINGTWYRGYCFTLGNSMEDMKENLKYLLILSVMIGLLLGLALIFMSCEKLRQALVS